MLDTLEIFGVEYTNVTGIKATDDQSGTKVYIRPQGTKSISANGTGIDVAEYASVDVNVSAPSPSLQSKTYNVSSAGTATVTADSGYDGLSSVQVSVPTFNGAIDIDAGGFSTVSNQRKWKVRGWVSADIGEDGYIGEGNEYGEYTYYNAVPSGTTVTPTTSSQTIGGDNYMMEDAVTVAAMPSGTAGTPTATKGSVSNHSISVTPSVTNTTGYITGSTKTGTAVTVYASELVSGTYTVDSSGTKDVTNYASASVPAMTLPNVSSTTSTGTRKGDIVSEDANSRYLNIPVGFNDTAQYYEIHPCVLGQKNITSNGTYYADDDDLFGYGAVTVNVSGGGSSMQIGNLDGVATSTSSISFTGLQGEPTAFSFMIDTSVATGTPSKIVAVVFDGTSLHAQTITNTSNAQVTYDSTSLSKTYSNGTLTITSSGPSFVTDAYYGVYVYDGGAVETKDVQVGSGATSITFTGLEDEPAWWSCIFKSNFGTSSGYQRVIYVAKGNTTTNVSGMEMDSGAHNAAHWTASYNNGSFTITSQGTNAGGYFHQPGYYQLTYAYDDGSGGNYQSKTVTPTTSQQVVQADSGYDALKKVTVNAMPTMTLPTATSATSSGTSKATITPTSSTQYLNIPTGYNDTAQYYTISATSGGSVTVKTTTMSNTSATATQIQFTSLTGQPKAFFCRCTSNLSRNSSNRYYYIADIRWDGSSSGGVVGNKYYVYNGQYSNQTTGYSYTYSSGTLTLSTTGSQSASPGSFYNGTYELVYVY